MYVRISQSTRFLRARAVADRGLLTRRAEIAFTCTITRTRNHRNCCNISLVLLIICVESRHTRVFRLCRKGVGSWSERRIKEKKYKMPGKMHQSTAVARGPKRLAERFHQLRTGHCRTGQYLEWAKNANTAAYGWVSIQEPDTELPVQRMQTMAIAAENVVGRGPKSYRKREESHQDPRPPRRRAAHPTSPRLPTHHRCGK